VERPPSVAVRGALAGIIGAAVLALWFLVVDLIRGEPFGTVTFLSGILTGREIADPAIGPIALYTLFHFGVFTLLGVALAYVFERTPIIPNVLMGIAVGLLLFAGVFYAGILVTGPDVTQALGWPELLVGNVLAGIWVMEALRLLGPERERGWWESLGESTMLKDGLTAGFLGATTVALWFFVPDVLFRQAFFTPAALGSALLLGVTEQAAVQISVLTVGLYTVVHYTIFILIGLLASAFLSKAEESPRALFFGMLFFIAYGAFFIGIIALFGEWILGALAWWSILAGTVLAVVVMAVYLVRAHPGLRSRLRAQESETAPPPITP
jgi:hypothetical protein